MRRQLESTWGSEGTHRGHFEGKERTGRGQADLGTMRGT